MTDIKCPECGSTSWIRKGKDYSRSGIFQRYQCKICFRFFKDKTTIADRKELVDNNQEE